MNQDFIKYIIKNLIPKNININAPTLEFVLMSICCIACIFIICTLIDLIFNLTIWKVWHRFIDNLYYRIKIPTKKL